MGVCVKGETVGFLLVWFLLLASGVSQNKTLLLLLSPAVETKY